MYTSQARLSMTDATEKGVRIIRPDKESILQAKDEEYAYWQSRPPLERLVAMQELSFASFEERGNEAEVRRQFLRSPRCLRRLDKSGER
jgi:hypothetical protein